MTTKQTAEIIDCLDGMNPFVQYNIDKKPTKRINRLRRWANRKQAFWSFDIADYDRKS